MLYCYTLCEWCNGWTLIIKITNQPLHFQVENINTTQYWLNIVGCIWHAADTPPFEGLVILRCAIYDPLEGLQFFKNQGFRNGGTGFDFRRC